MSAHSWPELGSVEAPTPLAKITILKSHCRAIMQYFLHNLQAPAPPPAYIAQFAVTTHHVLDEVTRYTVDGMAAAQTATQIRLEQTAKEIAAVAAAVSQDAPVRNGLVEKWAKDTRPGGTTAPHTSIPAGSSLGTAGPTEHDLRIRLRWQTGQAPYRNTPPDMIRAAVNGALGSSEDPAIRGIVVGAARKLKSGDLDLYTHTVAEKERLVYYSNDWLPRLERGRQVRMLGTQYSILVHSVPIEFYPKSRAVVEAIDEVVRSNPGTLTQDVVAYLGWVKGYPGVGKKARSSLVMGFRDPRAANKAIQEGLFLRSERMLTELYDPGCRVLQCAKWLQFGHVLAMCSSAACCPFCSLAHPRKQCPVRKDPDRYRCVLCRQPHAATDKRQCPKWREQRAILETVQGKKARLFPIPDEASTGGSLGRVQTNRQVQELADTGTNLSPAKGEAVEPQEQAAEQPLGQSEGRPVQTQRQCSKNKRAGTTERGRPQKETGSRRRRISLARTLKADIAPVSGPQQIGTADLGAAQSSKAVADPAATVPARITANRRHDPLDDNMPSFDNTDALETVRQNHWTQIAAQIPERQRERRSHSCSRPVEELISPLRPTSESQRGRALTRGHPLSADLPRLSPMVLPPELSVPSGLLAKIEQQLIRPDVSEANRNPLGVPNSCFAPCSKDTTFVPDSELDDDDDARESSPDPILEGAAELRTPPKLVTTTKARSTSGKRTRSSSLSGREGGKITVLTSRPRKRLRR